MAFNIALTVEASPRQEVYEWNGNSKYEATSVRIKRASNTRIEFSISSIFKNSKILEDGSAISAEEPGVYQAFLKKHPCQIKFIIHSSDLTIRTNNCGGYHPITFDGNYTNTANKSRKEEKKPSRAIKVDRDVNKAILDDAKKLNKSEESNSISKAKFEILSYISPNVKFEPLPEGNYTVDDKINWADVILRDPNIEVSKIDGRDAYNVKLKMNSNIGGEISLTNVSLQDYKDLVILQLASGGNIGDTGLLFYKLNNHIPSLVAVFGYPGIFVLKEREPLAIGYGLSQQGDTSFAPSINHIQSINITDNGVALAGQPQIEPNIAARDILAFKLMRYLQESSITEAYSFLCQELKNKINMDKWLNRYKKTYKIFFNDERIKTNTDATFHIPFAEIFNTNSQYIANERIFQGHVKFDTSSNKWCIDKLTEENTGEISYSTIKELLPNENIVKPPDFIDKYQTLCIKDSYDLCQLDAQSSTFAKNLFNSCLEHVAQLPEMAQSRQLAVSGVQPNRLQSQSGSKVSVAVDAVEFGTKYIKFMESLNCGCMSRLISKYENKLSDSEQSQILKWFNSGSVVSEDQSKLIVLAARDKCMHLYIETERLLDKLASEYLFKTNNASTTPILQ